MEYDAILVANLFSREIYKQCQEIGIDLKKVIFLYNNFTMSDLNQDYVFAEKILGKEYAEIVKIGIIQCRAWKHMAIYAFQISGRGIWKATMCG